MLYSDISNTLKIKFSENEDTLAQVINSIALEEISLAELIDAQASQVSFLAELYNKSCCHVKAIIDINHSLNGILEKIIQLHIQHQLMLTSIIKITSSTANITCPNITPDTCKIQPPLTNKVNLPETDKNSTIPIKADPTAQIVSKTSDGDSHTIQISSPHKSHIKTETNDTVAIGSKINTNICVDSSVAKSDITTTVNIDNPATVSSSIFLDDFTNVCTDITQNFKCNLKGRGVGTVEHQYDQFYGGISIVQAFVCSRPEDIDHNFLCYSVHKGTRMQILKAHPKSMKIWCSLTKDIKKVVVEGQGTIVMKERFKPDVYDTGHFMLIAAYKGCNFQEGYFEMRITSSCNTSNDHFSGKVNIDNSKLIIGI